MSDWKWWAGPDEEWFEVGPCETREQAFDEAKDYFEGEGFHIIEARNPPLRLSEWADIKNILEHAEDNLEDSDRTNENDNGPWFEATKAQRADLADRIKRACDEWQDAHGLVFTTTTFAEARNAEYIEGGEDE